MSRSQAQPSHPFSWTRWSGDGVLRGGLLLLAGVVPARRRAAAGAASTLARRSAGGGSRLYLPGVLCLLVALEGPIHELSDHYLFSAHMVQHMLLIYAAPPLMLLGMPGWLLRPIAARCPACYR